MDGLKIIAERLKAQTNNVEILTLCNAVLSYVKDDCPECRKRKVAKAAAMKRWRHKVRNGSGRAAQG